MTLPKRINFLTACNLLQLSLKEFSSNLLENKYKLTVEVFSEEEYHIIENHQIQIVYQTDLRLCSDVQTYNVAFFAYLKPFFREEEILKLRNKISPVLSNNDTRSATRTPAPKKKQRSDKTSNSEEERGVIRREFKEWMNKKPNIPLKFYNKLGTISQWNAASALHEEYERDRSRFPKLRNVNLSPHVIRKSITANTKNKMKAIDLSPLYKEQ